jgi:hypothetical protein
MTDQPIDLNAALASFDASWSPRIVTSVNDYDVRIARVFEPTGTSTVGDRHDDIPDHVDATTGHRLT